ncbi:hypothetical protein KC330_g8065 [Hortaea werneckii]|nr:hypothetical protein KC330_g8065 [Hortaea werneckii]
MANPYAQGQRALGAIRSHKAIALRLHDQERDLNTQISEIRQQKAQQPANYAAPTEQEHESDKNSKIKLNLYNEEAASLRPNAQNLAAKANEQLTKLINPELSTSQPSHMVTETRRLCHQFISQTWDQFDQSELAGVEDSRQPRVIVKIDPQYLRLPEDAARAELMLANMGESSPDSNAKERLEYAASQAQADVNESEIQTRVNAAVQTALQGAERESQNRLNKAVFAAKTETRKSCDVEQSRRFDKMVKDKDDEILGANMGQVELQGRYNAQTETIRQLQARLDSENDRQQSVQIAHTNARIEELSIELGAKIKLCNELERQRDDARNLSNTKNNELDQARAEMERHSVSSRNEVGELQRQLSHSNARVEAAAEERKRHQSSVLRLTNEIIPEMEEKFNNRARAILAGFLPLLCESGSIEILDNDIMLTRLADNLSPVLSQMSPIPNRPQPLPGTEDIRWEVAMAEGELLMELPVGEDLARQLWLHIAMPNMSLKHVLALTEKCIQIFCRVGLELPQRERWSLTDAPHFFLRRITESEHNQIAANPRTLAAACLVGMRIIEMVIRLCDRFDFGLSPVRKALRALNNLYNTTNTAARLESNLLFQHLREWARRILRAEQGLSPAATLLNLSCPDVSAITSASRKNLVLTHHGTGDELSQPATLSWL